MDQTQEKIAEIFWRVTAIAAGFTVVLMSGINGALLDTGFGKALEFTVGALFGLLAVTVFAFVVATVTRLIGGMPTIAVTLIGGALLALWYLSANSPEELLRSLLDTNNWSWPLTLPDALSVLPLASIVLAVATLSGLATLIISGSLSHLARPFRIALWVHTVGITAIAIAVVVVLAGDGANPFPDDGAILSANRGHGELPDPAASGAFLFEHLTCGAGGQMEFAADTLELLD